MIQMSSDEDGENYLIVLMHACQLLDQWMLEFLCVCFLNELFKLNFVNICVYNCF